MSFCFYFVGKPTTVTVLPSYIQSSYATLSPIGEQIVGRKTSNMKTNCDMISYKCNSVAVNSKRLNMDMDDKVVLKNTRDSEIIFFKEM